MQLFYEKQLETVHLENFKGGKPIGVDVPGKLFPAALKVGALVHRGKPATTHYRDIHSWLRNHISFSAALLLVFDGRARYPPKGVRAHKERAADEEKNRTEAARLEALGDDASMKKADKVWERVIHRETLLDLTFFTMQLCTQLGVRWVVAPFEADHLLACLSERGEIAAVLPPHNDTDLPIYGIDNVLFRPKANGECSSMRVREMLLGKARRGGAACARQSRGPVVSYSGQLSVTRGSRLLRGAVFRYAPRKTFNENACSRQATDCSGTLAPFPSRHRAAAPGTHGTCLRAPTPTTTQNS